MMHLLQQLLYAPMRYTSLSYYLLVGVSVAVYYLLPAKHRWLVLAGTSTLFLLQVSGSAAGTAVFLLTVLAAWIWGLVLERAGDRAGQREKERETEAQRGKDSAGENCRGRGEEKAGGKESAKRLLPAAVLTCALPLLAVRAEGILYADIFRREAPSMVIPVGLSFYSLQIIAYLADISDGKIRAQRNPLKFYTFAAFFPQLIQGPIPRYAQLEEQLLSGHRFRKEEAAKGLMLILWGFFLKYMIADRAGLFVDAVFGDWERCDGTTIFVAAVLYSIQLYTDFLSCTTLSQGVSQLYGIRLADNFRHPYFSLSVRDFWRRWHMSLSFWLRDYVYIPLGGSRRGKVRKYINLILTFAVSGIWHGGSVRFLFWGLLHALYQICEGTLAGARERICGFLHLRPGSWGRKVPALLWTFLRVMSAWIIFRADTLYQGLAMIGRMFADPAPGAFASGAFPGSGLDGKDWLLLAAAVLFLLITERRQEKYCIRDRVLALPLPVRWLLYTASVLSVLIFGSWGMGYSAADFIYGGF